MIVNSERDIEEMAEFLHDQYEECASESGWQTQDGTSVDFEDLPNANKQTMRMVARELIAKYDVKRRHFQSTLEEDNE